MTDRLSSTDDLPTEVARPAYARYQRRHGIVHIGLGTFHKAHQAVYTDDALAARDDDWRIIGVSLRSTAPSEELTPQDCLYTVIERSVAGTHARVIGSIAAALSLKCDRQSVLDALCDENTRIVSLTVTEKGYGIDRRNGGVDPNHPAIAADLADPEKPEGVAGLLVWALARRSAEGIPPFTVLCCDNLPENGALMRSLLMDFARRTQPELVDHIARDVSFPSTMVDRIAPARRNTTLTLAEGLLGKSDMAAVECEAFRQWVIEDDFPTGRPIWEAGGALFVDDVRPYEEMKLRMLNGTHSMLSYAGFLAGRKYVRDVMADNALAILVARHLGAAAATLGPVPGIDLAAYAEDLSRRFANPHLAHETYQIAMDGSEKMPQRIFAPTMDAIRLGQPIEPFAFAAAAWMRYTTGRTDTGEFYALRDPMEDRLKPAPSETVSAESIMARVLELPGLVPDLLARSDAWRRAVEQDVAAILRVGMAQAITEKSLET